MVKYMPLILTKSEIVSYQNQIGINHYALDVNNIYLMLVTKHALFKKGTAGKHPYYHPIHLLTE